MSSVRVEALAQYGLSQTEIDVPTSASVLSKNLEEIFGVVHGYLNDLLINRSDCTIRSVATQMRLDGLVQPITGTGR